MKLVYKETGQEVKVGDKVTTFRGGKGVVTFFTKPHKSSSEGKVCIKSENCKHENEYYVSVIGATWIEREDR